MSKDCGHTVPCGCGDKALTTKPPCNESGPCAGEPCAEIFCSSCIAHCGEPISYAIGGTVITINTGDRFDAIIENVIIAMINPDCIGKTASDLVLSDITTTGVTISWTGVPPNTYDIKWEKVSGGGETNVSTTAGVYTQAIGGMAPDTEYTIYIQSNETCNSGILTFKTLP